MKSKFITLFLLLSAVSCSNDNSNVLQRLNEAPATVREVQGANSLFVLELANNTNGLYSTYVVPSPALPAEYKEDGLSVLISGDVTNNSVAIDGYISENEENTVTLNGLYNTVEVTAMNEIIEIPFGDYSLEETPCNWKKLDYYGAIIINSNEKLENYIECTGVNNYHYPTIDFSKHTLLLALGVEGTQNSPDYTRLQQYSKQNYVMTVNLKPNAANAIKYWQVPIIVSKIANNSTVELKVTYKF